MTVNPFKWFVCWWYRRHLDAAFFDENGKKCFRCYRCGSFAK
jgi:hypothetical protein